MEAEQQRRRDAYSVPSITIAIKSPINRDVVKLFNKNHVGMIEHNSSHTEELNVFHDELMPQNGVCQGTVTKGKGEVRAKYILKVKDDCSIVRFSTSFLNVPLSKEMGPVIILSEIV
jgi:hypothetical protein